ncbi:MAG TPA: NAD(P)-dependent oxidoreductase [candidate division Zixibacteria bacterium]|nr:NAD(P)-dependent oxidoreductase [candidate division Zixibacteria bacterium]
MNKIIVTGATGFIGSHCLPLLVAEGYEVHAITTRKVRTEDRNIIWHCLDLFDSRMIETLFSEIRPTHLLHFAWTTEHGVYWNSMDNFNWLKAGVTILQKFAAAGGERIVMAGTCAEYDWRYGLCSEQITPLNPHSVYGNCKKSLQQLTESFCTQTGLSWAWGRIFFLYGPRENPLRLVPSVINALLQNREARCSAGTQIRDYLYVKDVASAFVKVMGSGFNGSLNIASGKAVTVRDIVSAIAEKVGRPDLIKFGGVMENKDEPPMILADTRQLSVKIGWQPEYDLKRGLAETISYWKGTAGAACDD